LIKIDHLVVEANFQLANPFRTLDRNVLPLTSRDNLCISNLILFIDGQPVETIVLNAKLNLNRARDRTRMLVNLEVPSGDHFLTSNNFWDASSVS